MNHRLSSRYAPGRETNVNWRLTDGSLRCCRKKKKRKKKTKKGEKWNSIPVIILPDNPFFTFEFLASLLPGLLSLNPSADCGQLGLSSSTLFTSGSKRESCTTETEKKQLPPPPCVKGEGIKRGCSSRGEMTYTLFVSMEVYWRTRRPGFINDFISCAAYRCIVRKFGSTICSLFQADLESLRLAIRSGQDARYRSTRNATRDAFFFVVDHNIHVKYTIALKKNRGITFISFELDTRFPSSSSFPFFSRSSRNIVTW